MVKTIKLTEEQFLKLRKEIGVEIICENGIDFIDYARVIHMDGSSKYHPKHHSSWSEYWEITYRCPVAPINNICDCCCEKKTESEFIVGHITEIDTGDSFLYPICKECNDIGKGDGNHPFLASKKLMRPFNFSDADIEND